MGTKVKVVLAALIIINVVALVSFYVIGNQSFSNLTSSKGKHINVLSYNVFFLSLSAN